MTIHKTITHIYKKKFNFKSKMSKSHKSLVNPKLKLHWNHKYESFPFHHRLSPMQVYFAKSNYIGALSKIIAPHLSPSYHHRCFLDHVCCFKWRIPRFIPTGHIVGPIQVSITTAAKPPSPFVVRGTMNIANIIISVWCGEHLSIQIAEWITCFSHPVTFSNIHTNIH